MFGMSGTAGSAAHDGIGGSGLLPHAAAGPSGMRVLDPTSGQHLYAVVVLKMPCGHEIRMTNSGDEFETILLDPMKNIVWTHCGANVQTILLALAQIKATTAAQYSGASEVNPKAEDPQFLTSDGCGNSYFLEAAE